MANPLWLFWGQPTMSFLRWMTLRSSIAVHDDVRLILRRKPVDLAKARATAAKWHGGSVKLDFSFDSMGDGTNWLERCPAGIQIVYLEDLAPELAALEADDVHTSDLLTWWLLANEGGTISDMDVIYYQRIADPPAPISVVRYRDHPAPGYMPIGFLQGSPHPFWNSMLERALRQFNPAEYQGVGPSLFPKKWDDIPEPKVLLDERIVYPFAGHPWGMYQGWLFKSDVWPQISPATIGVHWYGGFNSQWNDQMTMETVRKMKGCVANLVRHILYREEFEPESVYEIPTPRRRLRGAPR